MLWEIFAGIGAVMLVIVPIQIARGANAGFGVLTLAIAVGLIFAVMYEVAAHLSANALERRIAHCSTRVRSWYYASFYVATMLFPVVVLLIAAYHTAAL